MKPKLLTNLLSEDDIKKINDYFDNPAEEHLEINQGHRKLGRFSVQGGNIPIEADVNSLDSIITDDLHCNGYNIVEYSLKYGEPNLPPHYDRDNSEIIINYQLSSNVSWGIGVDEELYLLEDNQAVAFNPNKSIHWRPIKEFKPGEFVRMAFFRYQFKENPKEYSDLPDHPDNETFAKIHEIRNNLK